MPRFVILRHQSPRGEHFDFMLEVDGILKTWALPRPPELGAEMDCEALSDHRIEYLDYEGPVSGARGAVTCFDRGKYTVERCTDTEWDVQLVGERALGQVKLVRHSRNQDCWRFVLTGAGQESRG